MATQRLDLQIIERGLVESREKAQRLIRAGKVRVQGQPATKPGHEFPLDAEIEIETPPPFVSRGGEKMAGAFKAFPLNVQQAVCLDVGASTGGFTDCLLQHGARKVYAVDVGKGQLHWSLRQDKRVVPHEGVNARHLDATLFDEPPVFAVVDVSFISLTKIMPAIHRVLASEGQVVTLIKPQFEAGRDQVGKGGVVRDPAIHQSVIEKVRHVGEQELGWMWKDCVESPLVGPAGNIEFLSWWRKP